MSGSDTDDYSETEDEADQSAKVITMERNEDEIKEAKLKRRKELEAKKVEERKCLWLDGMGSKSKPPMAGKKADSNLEKS